MKLMGPKSTDPSFLQTFPLSLATERQIRDLLQRLVSVNQNSDTHVVGFLRIIMVHVPT
jgi:hypothetical protein